jgi:hypothetical protein
MITFIATKKYNMKKKDSLTVFLLLFSLVTFGQVKLSKDFKVTTATPYKVVDAKTKDYISDGKGYTIAVKTDGEKVVIQRFDFTSMKEVSRKVYEDLPPNNKVQKVMKVGDKLFYIFSSFNKKDKKEDIYSREINMNDGTFQSAKLLFSTASEVNVSSYADPTGPANIFGMGSPIRFEVHTSFDNSKILIRYRLKPEKKDDSKSFDILGFYVFDSNFQKQWGGEVKMPYTEKEMNNLAYGVSKEGKAFMLAYINSSKKFELLKIGNDLTVKTSKIDIDGNLVFQEFFLQETVDGNLTCIGYYANGVEVKVNWTATATLSLNVNGILSFTMDQNGKILAKHDFEFPLELINQYESARAKAKNEKREDKGKAGINDLKVISIGFDADGSTTIVGEQQYIRKEMVYTKQAIVHYYADMIATKFDKNGKLLWMKKLPKTQVGQQGKGGMSVRYIKGKGASYILYLDNVKNANLSLADVPDKHSDGRGGYLTAYKIDDVTGAIEKHSILNIDDINGIEAFQFKTPRIFEGKDKVFLLEIYIKGKMDTVVKMELLK